MATERLIVLTFADTVMVGKGERIVEGRICDYPFDPKSLAQGTKLVQAVYEYADRMGYERGLKAGQRASALRDRHGAQRHLGLGL